MTDIMVRLSIEEQVQLIADEQTRRAMLKLFPHYSPIYPSGKNKAHEGDTQEHTYFLAHTCDVMEIIKELGLPERW